MATRKKKVLTKPDVSEEELHVLNLIRKWVPILGLEAWKIDIDLEFRHDYLPCRVSALWAYLHAHLQVNVPLLFTLNDEQLEETIVHELVHVVLSELRDDSKEEDLHEERTATILARAFMRIVKKA